MISSLILIYSTIGFGINEVALRGYAKKYGEVMPTWLYICGMFFWPMFLFMAAFGKDVELLETDDGDNDA